MAVNGSVMAAKITVSRHWASADGLALSILHSQGMSPLYQSPLGDGYIDCPASPLPAKILIQQAWGRHHRTVICTCSWEMLAAGPVAHLGGGTLPKHLFGRLEHPFLYWLS